MNKNTTSINPIILILFYLLPLIAIVILGTKILEQEKIMQQFPEHNTQKNVKEVLPALTTTDNYLPDESYINYQAIVNQYKNLHLEKTRTNLDELYAKATVSDRESVKTYLTDFRFNSQIVFPIEQGKNDLNYLVKLYDIKFKELKQFTKSPKNIEESKFDFITREYRFNEHPSLKQYEKNNEQVYILNHILLTELQKAITSHPEFSKLDVTTLSQYSKLSNLYPELNENELLRKYHNIHNLNVSADFTSCITPFIKYNFSKAPKRVEDYSLNDRCEGSFTNYSEIYGTGGLFN